MDSAKGFGKTSWLLGCVVGLLATSAWAQAPTYSVEVAAVDGVPVTPTVNMIEVEPGDEVTVEVFLRNWSVGGVPLKAYQFSFNPAGYTSGFSGNINPKDFATTTNSPVACGNTDTNGPENTANAFININRPDFVHLGLNPFDAVGTRRCGYRYGSAVQAAGPTSVLNVKKYCGTLILKVSNDATGTFTLTLDPDANTKTFLRSGFANDQPVSIPGLVIEPLTINVVPDIDYDIIAAFPPNNAVDARQPTNLDGSNATGITSVDLTFNKPAANLSPGDFTVSTNPPGGAPGILSVTPNGSKVTVTFNTFIPLQKWTTITHNDATPTNTRVGYLPGDVDNNRVVDPTDIWMLVQALDEVVILSVYQYDINRSNGLTPMDMLAGINLFNGAQAFDVWAGRTLP